MAVSQTNNGPRFTMTQTDSGAYDVVIDGVDELAGYARRITASDISEGVVGSIGDPLYPVHVRSSASMEAALDLGIEMFKRIVGDGMRAKHGRSPGMDELLVLGGRMAGSKQVALTAWEA